MVKREKSNYMIQSVSHALDVLEELCKSRGEVGVTELSKRLKLHKNNVFRLLATLEMRGYVEQNSDSEDYRLGVKSLELGQSYLIQSSIVERATPLLKALCESTGETVSFAVLHNAQEVQYPLSFSSKRPVRVAPRVAVSFQVKFSAAGRLLLAQMPDNDLEEILAPNTPQDAAIKNQLADLRAQGMIVDRGAIETDVISICKIIKGDKGRVLGAIEMVAPQYRAKVEDLVAAVEEVAEKLSATMGYSKKSLSSGVEVEVTMERMAEGA
jgi:IclR family transcriptional regulator, KDG regulon repressor